MMSLLPYAIFTSLNIVQLPPITEGDIQLSAPP